MFLTQGLYRVKIPSVLHLSKVFEFVLLSYSPTAHQACLVIVKVFYVGNQRSWADGYGIMNSVKFHTVVVFMRTQRTRWNILNDTSLSAEYRSRPFLPSEMGTQTSVRVLLSAEYLSFATSFVSLISVGFFNQTW